MRGLFSFCANFAIIIEVHLLINKVTLKRQMGINSICKRPIIFSDFLQVTLSNLKVLTRRYQVSYSSVATTIENNFCD